MQNQTTNSLTTLTASLVLGACLTLTPAIVSAGPVPGVDEISKQPVEFPTPPSLQVWITEDEDYLVTFNWNPGRPVTNPGVAGSFNNWDRADLPMDGPDEKGNYSVTALIGAGEWEYKFVAGTDGWFSDPLNPEQVDAPGDPNSVLLLGFAALMRDRVAARGDGEIEGSAVLHDPNNYTFYDQFNETDVTLRVRALRNDVEQVFIDFLTNEGEVISSDELDYFTTDSLFDYYTTTTRTAKLPAMPSAYRVRVVDGEGTYIKPKEYPFALDSNRIMVTPEWAKDAIWYQIMIDRFRDGDPSNNPEFTKGTSRVEVTHPWTSDWYEELEYERQGGQTFWRWSMYNRLYGGDFQGVIDQLDYLKDLGVTAIYFNPVFEATNAHKYNARSFVHADDGYGVAGEFQKSLKITDDMDSSTWEFNGSDQKLLELIREIKARDMKVIFDGVFNHVGSDHPAFLDVQENLKESRFADWFDIRSWDPFEYSGWGGFDGLPEFRKTENDLASESYKQHVFDVTRRWMDPLGNGDTSAGIDGWRLDVPMHIPFGFWEEWMELVKSINPEAYVVGEVWDPAEEWLQKGRFDAVMNYQIPKAAFPWFSNVGRKTTVSEFDRALKRLYIRYPRNATYVLQNLFDSHDTDRWVSRIANPDLNYDAANRIQDTGPNFFDERPDEAHYQRLRLMAIFQSTWVGAPMIWYGTEVGMYGADDPHTRMPMWWEDLMPYDNPDYRIDESLREHFRTLFHLRNGEEILRRGDFKTAIINDEADVYGYLRYLDKGGEAILVVLNNGNADFRIALDEAKHGFNGTVELLYGGATLEGEGTEQTLVVSPVNGAILRIGG